MTTARTFVRFAFAGLFVNFLAVACVVSGGDDDDDTTSCDPGATQDCTCSDGDEGTKKCNSSGSGYGACDCTGAGTGGTGSGGEGGTATAGTTSNAGQTSTPLGGAGGQSTGGAGGAVSEGGAGGATTDLCVDDEEDACQGCVQVTCCDEWTACSADTANDCQQQFFNIMACARADVAERDIKPEDLETCAVDEAGGDDVWSTGILQTTKALIDCTGGGADWENRAWNNQSCNALCFLQE